VVPAISPSQAATFTFNNPNCSSFSFDPIANTLTCNSTSPPTFGCSITASPSAPTLTQPVTLTATCSNAATGGTVTYTWSNATNAGGCPAIALPATTSSAALVAPTATSAVNCTYNLSASDGTTT